MESRRVIQMETCKVTQGETHASIEEDARSPSLPNPRALKKDSPSSFVLPSGTRSGSHGDVHSPREQRLWEADAGGAHTLRKLVCIQPLV